jgi:hypothetical protein
MVELVLDSSADQPMSKRRTRSRLDSDWDWAVGEIHTETGAEPGRQWVPFASWIVEEMGQVDGVWYPKRATERMHTMTGLVSFEDVFEMIQFELPHELPPSTFTVAIEDRTNVLDAKMKRLSVYGGGPSKHFKEAIERQAARSQEFLRAAKDQATPNAPVAPPSDPLAWFHWLCLGFGVFALLAAISIGVWRWLRW